MDFVNLNDLVPLIPELIVLATGITVLFVDLFAPSKNRMTTLALTSLAGLAMAMMAEIRGEYDGSYKGKRDFAAAQADIRRH